MTRTQYVILFTVALAVSVLVGFMACTPYRTAVLHFLMPLTPLLMFATVVDAARWTQKMIDRVKNAGQAWADGVTHPRRSPTTAMKAAAGKWTQRMQAAIANNTWQKKIATLTDDSIKQAALKVGPQKFIDGITARQDKIAAAIAKLQPKVSALSSRIQGMPQDTDQQREQRMVENLRGMRAIKGS